MSLSQWPRAVGALLLVSLSQPALAQGTPQRRAANPPTQAAPAANADALAEQARERIQAGDHLNGLALAQQASRAQPSNYKGPYYEAYALMMMGEYASAAQAVERSRQATRTEEQRSAVEALAKAVAGGARVKEADAAAADGLSAKAARLYKEAYDSGYPSADPALKAAQLFERTQDYATAARLLKSVQERYAGSPASATAARELARVQGKLTTVAEAKLREALEQPPGRRSALLQEAQALDPGNTNVMLAWANEAMLADDWAVVESHLRALLRAQTLDKAIRSGGLQLGKWRRSPQLKSLLEDAWGPQLAAEALDSFRHAVVGVVLGTTDGKPPRPKILSFNKGSVAEKAGMKANDILVSVGGVDVSYWQQVRRAVARLPIGLPAIFVVERAGQQHRIAVVPEAGPRGQGDCYVAFSKSPSPDYTYKGTCNSDGWADDAGEVRWKEDGQDWVFQGKFLLGYLEDGKGTQYTPGGPVAWTWTKGTATKAPAP